MTAYADFLKAGGTAVITPAVPISSMVMALRARYRSSASFSWYADDAHYQAVPPQDHTPYSADAWPLPDPRWWVFATDVMVTSVGGQAEAQRLFDYWISEARSGRMPWLKYLIWKAKIYDVRYNWTEQDSSGHYDHIHISARTDHQFTQFGAWRPFPDGGTTMDPIQEAKLLKQVSDIAWSVAAGAPKQPGAGTGNEAITYWAAHVTERMVNLQTAVEGLSAAVAKLSSGPVGAGVSADEVRVIVRQELDASHLTGS